MAPAMAQKDCYNQYVPRHNNLRHAGAGLHPKRTRPPESIPLTYHDKVPTQTRGSGTTAFASLTVSEHHTYLPKPLPNGPVSAGLQSTQDSMLTERYQSNATATVIGPREMAFVTRLECASTALHERTVMAWKSWSCRRGMDTLAYAGHYSWEGCLEHVV